MSVKVLFLGQCLQYGYEGVRPTVTFPKVAASLLRSRFSNVKFSFDMKHLYHPVGLKTLLRHRLSLTQPDIVVIGLPAMFAATHWRVNLVYEMAPEIVDTARTFMRKIETRLHGGGQKASTLIDKTFRVRAPLEVTEYEKLIRESLEYCRQTSGCRVILFGPGRFNEDTVEDYPVHSPELWAAVNQMIERLGKDFNVPVISVQNTLSGFGGEVFISSNHRFSEYGHEIVAREVASVIATQIAASGSSDRGDERLIRRVE